MDDVVLVDEVGSADELPHVLFNLAVVQSVGVILQLFQQCVRDVLEDQEDLALPAKDLDEADDVFVLELLEDADLAHGGFSDLSSDLESGLPARPHPIP